MRCSCLREQGEDKEHEYDKDSKSNPEADDNWVCNVREENMLL